MGVQPGFDKDVCRLVVVVAYSESELVGRSLVEVEYQPVLVPVVLKMIGNISVILGGLTLIILGVYYII